MAFKIPCDLIVRETAHWIVNHRADTTLPGYLIIGARQETGSLDDLPAPALTELGPLLAGAQKVVAELLGAEHVYLSRYGHSAGHAIHFHVIPVYPWMKKAFSADSRYVVLKTFYTPGANNSDFDGAELTLYIWREFCEKKTPPPSFTPSIAEVVKILKTKWPHESP